MGRGESKLKAKFAGAFVGFRGVFTLLWLAWDVLGGAEVGSLFLLNFFIALATFASGLGVLMASRKAYFAATLLTCFHLVFISGSLLGLLLDLSVLGALWKGWSIQIDESFSAAEAVKRRR